MTLCGTTTYTYDSVGNRLSKTSGGTTTNFTYDADDRNSSSTYTYNANGDVLNDGTHTFSYDFEDHLTGSGTQSGQTATYAYDADGNRIQKIDGTGTVNYLVDSKLRYNGAIVSLILIAQLRQETTCMNRIVIQISTPQRCRSCASKAFVASAAFLLLILLLATPVLAAPEVNVAAKTPPLAAYHHGYHRDPLPPSVLSVEGSDTTAANTQGLKPDDDSVQRGPASGQYDFGQVTVLDHPQVQHVFRLKNISTMPLVIASLHPSCVCTTAHLEPIALSHDQKATMTLAPGQETNVRVQVDLTDSGPAVLTKTVTILAQDNPQPVGYLTMTGTILPNVTFNPAFLDFGNLTQGKARSLTLTADLDQRLVPKGSAPTLISTNPDIQVTAQASTTVKAQGSKSLTTERTYLVTLAKNAPLGSFSGSLSFVPSIAVASSGAGSVTQSSPAQVSALTHVSALVLGQVTGDVSALPAQIAFGTIRTGHLATRQVVLTGVDDSALTGIAVSSASPWLTVRVGNLNEQPVFGNGGQPVPSSRVLYLTISDAAPPGVLQTQIKVTLANGQRLLLPVSANITMPTSAGS